MRETLAPPSWGAAYSREHWGTAPFGVLDAEQLRVTRSEGVDVVGFIDEFEPFGQPDGRVLMPRGQPHPCPDQYSATCRRATVRWCAWPLP